MFFIRPNLFQLSTTWSAYAPIWVKCHCCEEFLCMLHELHVSECECPDITRWLFSPYLH